MAGFNRGGGFRPGSTSLLPADGFVGYWANKQLFGVVSQLSAERFTQAVAGSDGSGRNTMVHILSEEWGWLDRCGGTRRGAALDASDCPTVESLVERWQQVARAQRMVFTSQMAAAALAEV